MKLYYAGDVHGSEKCWRKFLGAARFYEADTLIMGGDITGKLMVPVVETADGRHEAARARPARDRRRRRARGHREAHPVQRLLPVPVRPGRVRPPDRRHGLPRGDVHAAHDRRGAALDRACRGAAGGYRHPLLRHAGERRRVRDRRGARVDHDRQSRQPGRAGRTTTPRCSRARGRTRRPGTARARSRRSELLERLHGLAAQLEPGVTTIFNLHCPPHGTTLDRAPQLTDDLKVVLDGGEPRIVLGRLDGRAHPDRGGAARAVAARAHP